jgi:DNA-binding transcriptional ArsR family regulator
MVSKSKRQWDAVFRAIADPTRREILRILRRGPQTLGGVAHNFRMSRPAISKHMRLLHQAGLAAIRKEGTASICALDARPLHLIEDWLSDYQIFWAASLQGLKKYMEDGE